ncbi:Outer membrane lipoprotein carrier protein LolA [hydrothermal vent metagenome]|uniref:Outer-membrane lipoprotein carrier protein n=1 Tax=hydrothermal vent metagenome TaxID=652676 RepID=A0A3B0ZXL5_9ZZZZ
MKFIKLKINKLGLLIIFSFFMSTPLQAKTINDYLGHVKSMSAKFEQFVFNESTQEPEESSGTIAVISPDKFRLEYNKPYKQIYVADGVRLWSYDEDLEQVTVKKQEGLLANSPAMVLGNPGQLDTAYVIKAQGVTKFVDWFHMTPKNPDSQFDHIRLGFAGKNLYIMELYDSFGQRTQLKFSELQYNPEQNSDTFIFKIPDGVDVIGDSGE